MAYTGQLTGMGLPKALCVTSIKIHNAMLYREFSVPRLPIVEGLLESDSYRRGFLCTLVPPGGGRWEGWQQFENLSRCLSKNYQFFSVL